VTKLDLVCYRQTFLSVHSVRIFSHRVESAVKLQPTNLLGFLFMCPTKTACAV